MFLFVCLNNQGYYIIEHLILNKIKKGKNYQIFTITVSSLFIVALPINQSIVLFICAHLTFGIEVIFCR